MVMLEQVHTKQLKISDDPRLFFKQIMDASGLFPIEINVPDVLSTITSAMSTFGQSIYSFLSGSNSESMKEPINRDTNEDYNADKSGGERQKKVKKLKTGLDDLENLLELLSFVTIEIYLL